MADQCQCTICQLSRADRERALFYGWHGNGSVAPFLRALDARQGVTEYLGEGDYRQALCPRCRLVCTPQRHLECNDAQCPLRAAGRTLDSVIHDQFPEQR